MSTMCRETKRRRNSSSSAFQRIEIDRRQVAALLREVALLVEDVGDSATHAGGEVAPARAKHHDRSVGHVFATVVAKSFDDRGRSRIAHREALARNAGEERLPARRAIEHNVADDDVLLGNQRRNLGRMNDDAATRKPFAGVIVGVTFERERHALGQERTETLSGAALEVQADGVVGQSLRSITARDLSAQHGADGAVHVANRHRAEFHAVRLLHAQRALSR